MQNEARPLFVWLGADPNKDPSSPLPRLLLPPSHLERPTDKIVETAEDVLHLVNEHYASESQFVGGMGESDPGVWFATCQASSEHVDALDLADLVQESIQLVKEERHGVPFGLYTTGITNHPDLSSLLPELGLDSLQVSLFAGSPPDYKAATGLSDDASKKAFGQVCGLIVEAVELGVAVEVGVLQSYAGPARDLALSLGAREVHVYADSQ